MTDADLGSWHNKTCTHIGCADRVQLRAVEDKLEKKTEEYEEIYRKVTDMEEMLSKTADDIDKSETKKIIAENLRLVRELSHARGKISKLELDIDVLKEDSDNLKKEIEFSERKDRETIKRLHNIDNEKETQEQELDKLNEEVDFKRKSLEAMKELMSEHRGHYQENEDKLKVMREEHKVLKSEAECYRQEGQHYKSYVYKKTKRLVRHLNKAGKHIGKNKPVKAKKEFEKAKDEYLKLNIPERVSIDGQFDRVMKEVVK